MGGEVNTNNWVDGWKRSYSRQWMARFRSIFFDAAFYAGAKAHDKTIRTLDVGCGTAFFIERLLERGYSNVRGIEPDERLVPPYLRDRIDIGKATSLPHDDRSFDIIYFFNVVHHLDSVEDYKTALDEADRCLEPGGDLIFLEPNWPLFYKVEKIVSKVLARYWAFAAGIYDALISEWDLVMYFFKNRHVIKAHLEQKGYKVSRERHLVHQWILVCRRPD